MFLIVGVKNKTGGVDTATGSNLNAVSAIQKIGKANKIAASHPTTNMEILVRRDFFMSGVQISRDGADQEKSDNIR